MAPCVWAITRGFLRVRPCRAVALDYWLHSVIDCGSWPLKRLHLVRAYIDLVALERHSCRLSSVHCVRIDPIWASYWHIGILCMRYSGHRSRHSVVIIFIKMVRYHQITFDFISWHLPWTYQKIVWTCWFIIVLMIGLGVGGELWDLGVFMVCVVARGDLADLMLVQNGSNLIVFILIGGCWHHLVRGWHCRIDLRCWVLGLRLMLVDRAVQVWNVGRSCIAVTCISSWMLAFLDDITAVVMWVADRLVGTVFRVPNQSVKQPLILFLQAYQLIFVLLTIFCKLFLCLLASFRFTLRLFFKCLCCFKYVLKFSLNSTKLFLMHEL